MHTCTLERDRLAQRSPAGARPDNCNDRGFSNGDTDHSPTLMFAQNYVLIRFNDGHIMLDASKVADPESPDPVWWTLLAVQRALDGDTPAAVIARYDPSPRNVLVVLRDVLHIDIDDID